MTITFEIPREIERQLGHGTDLNREAKVVYLMELYRQARLSHRQLQDSLGLSFQDAERLLKERGLGQDIDGQEFETARERFRETRPQ